MTAYDSRGKRYDVGAHVAYNRSGDVISGVVEHITSSIIHIRPDNAWQSSNYPKISKVRNRRSILVIGDA